MDINARALFWASLWKGHLSISRRYSWKPWIIKR